MTCPKCGKSLPDDLLFCTRCGAKLDEEPSFAENTPTDAEEASEYTKKPLKIALGIILAAALVTAIKIDDTGEVILDAWMIRNGYNSGHIRCPVV